MRIAAVIVCALAAGGCAPLHRAPLPFLERTYVARVPRDTSILYEAQVATHILAVDGLANAYDKITQQPAATHASAVRFIITPMFRIRQLRDSSSAVRTPSFMPRISGEWLLASRVGPVDIQQTSLGNIIKFSTVNLTGVRLTLAHHSNGQAGCFRNGFTPVDARSNDCKPIAGYDTNIVELNRANGDFSSTFVNLTVHTTFMNRSGNDEATHSMGGAVGFDYHPPGIFGALSDEQRQLYGSWRLHAQTEGMLHVLPDRFGGGRARITLEGERAPRFPGELAHRIEPAVLPYRWSVEASYGFDALLGAGAFVRWHDGQDYYNIGFVNRRKVFMAGLMLDFSGIDRIGANIFQQ